LNVSDASRAWRSLPVEPRRLLMVDLVSTVGTGLVLPFLAVYVARIRAQGVTTGGLALSALAAGSLVANVLAGRALDRVGVKAVLQLGWLVAAAGDLWLLSARDAVPLLGAAALIGIGNGAAYPALRSGLGQFTPGEQRGVVFGIQHGLLNVGLSVGTLLAAALVVSANLARFQLLYALDAVSFVVAAALLIRLPLPRPVRPPAVPEEEAGRSRGGGYRQVLADPAFRWICLIEGLVVVCGYAQYHVMIPVYLARRGGLPFHLIALVFAVNTVTVVVASLPVALKFRSVGKPTLAAVGAGCFAGCWVLLAVSGHQHSTATAFLVAALAAATMGLGETFLAPSLGPWVNDLAPEELRGRYNGVDALVLSTGTIAGPLLTAALFAGASSPALFAVLFGGCVAAGVVAATRSSTAPEPARALDWTG